MKKKFTLCALALTFTLHLFAPADRIVFSSGRVAEGRILSRDGNRVTIETGGSILQISADMITSVEKAEEYENTLLSAESSFKRRDAVSGIEHLLRARREGAPVEPLQTLFQRYNGGITGAIHQTEPRERAALRLALNALMEAEILAPRGLYMLSMNYFQMDDWEGTTKALEMIPRDKLRADPNMRVWALDFMRQWVRRLFQRGEFEKAIAYVEKMREITDDNADDPQLPLAHLTRSAAAREMGNYPEAFQVIAEDLHPLVPEIARNRTLYAVEDMLRRIAVTKDFAIAREGLGKIRNVFPIEHAVALNRLVTMQALDRMEAGHPEAALALVEEIVADQRSDELEQLHRLAYHEMMLDELQDATPLELLKHGRWCAENGLLEQALVIFAETRKNANLREVSDELTVTARRDRDTKLLEEAQKAYDNGRLNEVMENTHAIIANPDVGSALQKEAEKLQELAIKSMNREVEQRPYMAEVFYQNAERAFFLQNFEESFSLVNMILDIYPDTPAAKRAVELLPDILRAIEISYLEGRPVRLPEIPASIPRDRLQRADLLSAEAARLMEAFK